MALFRGILRNVGLRSAIVANLGSSLPKLNLEKKRVGSLPRITDVVDVRSRTFSPKFNFGPFISSLHTHSPGNGRYLEDVKHTVSVELKKFYLGDVLEEIIWRISNGIESGCLDAKRMPIIDNQVFLADDPYVAGKYCSYLDSVKDFIKDFHQPDIARMTPREVQLYQDFTLYLQKTTRVRHLALLRAHPHLHTRGQELMFIWAAYDQFDAIPNNSLDNTKKHFPELHEDHHNSPVDLPPASDQNIFLMQWEVAYNKMVERNGRKVDIKGSISHLPPEFERQRVKGQYENAKPVEEIRYFCDTLKHIHEQYPLETEVIDTEVLKQLRTAAPMIDMEIFQFYWCYDGHARGAINLNFIYDPMVG